MFYLYLINYNNTQCRLLSIGDGVDNLPCSIILTRELLEGGAEVGEEVIGHARLMPVAGDCTAAFIETGNAIHNNCI